MSVRGDRKLRANLQLLSPNVQKLLGGSPTGLSLGVWRTRTGTRPLEKQVAHASGNHAEGFHSGSTKPPGMATFLIGGISLTPELVNLFFGDSTCIGDRGEPDARGLRSRRAPPLLRSFKSEKKHDRPKALSGA